MSLITILITSILVGNTVLVEFLGVNSILGLHKERKALSMGLIIASTAVLTTILIYFVYNYILEPLNIEFLRTMITVLIMVLSIPLIEKIIEKYFSSLNDSFGKYVSVLIANCTVMGIALLNIDKGYNLLETLFFAVGSGIGFILVLYVFSTISEHIGISPVIKPLKGFPITLITIGLMAMILARYIWA